MKSCCRMFVHRFCCFKNHQQHNTQVTGGNAAETRNLNHPLNATRKSCVTQSVACTKTESPKADAEVHASEAKKKAIAMEAAAKAAMERAQAVEMPLCLWAKTQNHVMWAWFDLLRRQVFQRVQLQLNYLMQHMQLPQNLLLLQILRVIQPLQEILAMVLLLGLLGLLGLAWWLFMFFQLRVLFSCMV